MGILVLTNCHSTMPKCPVCFKKANYTTSCNHAFCKRCLYKWGGTCPLCRADIELDYPNTRAMSTLPGVRANAEILLTNIAITKKTKDKVKYAEKLLQYLWDNRVVIRKYCKLCKTIREKSVYIRKECIDLGFVPPEILTKTVTI